MSELRHLSAEIVAKALGKAKKTGQGWSCLCPSHHDETASLSVSEGNKSLLVHCHAGCAQEAVVDALKARSLWSKPVGEKTLKPRIIATYDYEDQNGELVFQVCRYEPKAFKQRYPDPAASRGGWIWKKSERQVPFNLLEVLRAIADGDFVFIVEGEKDALNLKKLGLTGSCNAMGAGKWKGKLAEALTPHFALADVVILPDNDEPGRQHADDVARALTGVAASVRVLHLSDLPEKGDVSDWIAKGGTAEQLLALAEKAEPWTEPTIPPTQTVEPESSKRPIANLRDLDGFKRTEDGLALAFAARHKNDLRFCHTTGAWFQWTGAHWRKERTKLAFSWARAICRELNQQNDDRLEKASTAAAVEKFAQADRGFVATSEIWDRDEFLLGTPGGTVELKTGRLRPAQQRDHITKTSAVAPSETANCPRWLEFLNQATQGNAELVRFMQQVAGYSLTGDVREHALFFVYGQGGNGKGVFLNTITKILGDYATAASMETFVASQHDKHPTDLAKLHGARLVTASETEEGRAWAEARIKALTGGDRISARFMRQDFFDFDPQFKLLIIGNHKPVLHNVDNSVRRRFNIIPFDHIPPKPDMQLERKLKNEWPGILRWMIDGCLDWQRNGLVRPKIVTDTTDEYFSEQDLMGKWIEECCDIGGRNISDTVDNLFKSWSEFSLRSGEKPGTMRSFNQSLRKYGYEYEQFWDGILRGKRGFRRIMVKPVDTSNQWQNPY